GPTRWSSCRHVGSNHASPTGRQIMNCAGRWSAKVWDIPYSCADRCHSIPGTASAGRIYSSARRPARSTRDSDGFRCTYLIVYEPSWTAQNPLVGVCLLLARSKVGDPRFLRGTSTNIPACAQVCQGHILDTILP